MTNGFPYDGQVLCTPGIAAGATGSGNVYPGRLASANSITWTGIPFVTPGPSGTRFLRITNVRANATTAPLTPPFQISTVSAILSAPVPVTYPAPVIAFGAPGLIFSTAFTSSSTVNLTFTENFATAFRPRIQSASASPFSMARQDIPATVYNTESQFTPCFGNANCSSPPVSPIGLADSGTLLLTQITGLGAGAAFLSVPNQVTDVVSGTAYLLVAGKPVTNAGTTSVPVVNGTVRLLYDIRSANPTAIDSFTIPATLMDSSGMPLPFPSQAAFTGQLGPVNNTATASSTAPEPRFAPQSQ